MADNTEREAPALPFDSISSTATLGKQLFPEQLLLDRTEKGASVQDISSLVGANVLDTLNIRGAVGSIDQSFENDSQLDRVRTPWVMTCQKWIEEGRYIISAVNPKDVSWRMPQRSVIQKTRVGEIVHVWKDRFRGTFYDEPQIAINFQSGNIMPIRQKPFVRGARESKQFAEKRNANGEIVLEDASSLFFETNKIDTSESEPRVPPGLFNFYEFLQLVDEQKILQEIRGPDGDIEQAGGDINLVYIMYNSRMFPSITLAGLFTPDGVSWTDSSDSPNEVTNWSANFTIYDSYPRLYDLNTLTTFFKNQGFGRI